MEHVRNATIVSTMLGEEHGTLTYMLHVDDGECAQGAGGVALGGPEGGPYLQELLHTIGASQWEQLRGRHLRIKREHPRGSIVSIGHIVEDRWFDIVPK